MGKDVVAKNKSISNRARSRRSDSTAEPAERENERERENDARRRRRRRRDGFRGTLEVSIGEVPAGKNAEAILRAKHFSPSLRDQRRRFEIRVRAVEIVESRGRWAGDSAVVRVGCGRFSRGSGGEDSLQRRRKGRTGRRR